MSDDPQTASKTLSGQFEVAFKKLKEVAGSGEVLDFNLKKVLPDFLGKSDYIPASIEKIWRRVVDDMLSKDRGIYHHKGGGEILIYFHELSSVQGKAKISLLKKEMLTLLEKVEGGKIDLPNAEKNKQQPVETNLSRLIKDGLGNNPTLEMLTIWMSRVFQNLTISTQKIPLSKEMANLAIKSNITYLPLWKVSSQAVIGSLCTIRSSVPVRQYATGEVLRQDLAALFGSCFQLYSMKSKNMQSMIVIPIRAASLNNENFVELYLTFLRRFDPKFKRSLIFEIWNFPKDNVPVTFKATIETLNLLSRAYIFETGFLTYCNYCKNFPKVHACGFNALEGNLLEDEKLRLIKKYAEQYAGFGIKTYIRSVANKKMLTTAAEAGFTYISGSIIGPASKKPQEIKKLPLSEIG